MSSETHPFLALQELQDPGLCNYIQPAVIAFYRPSDLERRNKSCFGNCSILARFPWRATGVRRSDGDIYFAVASSFPGYPHSWKSTFGDPWISTFLEIPGNPESPQNFLTRQKSTRQNFPCGLVSSIKTTSTHLILTLRSIIRLSDKQDKMNILQHSQTRPVQCSAGSGSHKLLPAHRCPTAVFKSPITNQRARVHTRISQRQVVRAVAEPEVSGTEYASGSLSLNIPQYTIHLGCEGRDAAF